MRRALLVFVVGGAAQGLGLPLAWADAISPPPACPPGSHGRSSHAGQWCEPSPCTSDADCKSEGEVCRPWRVCTRVSSAVMGSRRSGRPPTDVTLVVGSCAPDRGCTGTEEPPPSTIGELESGPPSCKSGSYCVPPTLPELPTAAPGQGPAGSSTTGAGDPHLPGSRAGGPKGCGCRLANRAEFGVGLAALALAAGVGAGLRRAGRARAGRTGRGRA